MAFLLKTIKKPYYFLLNFFDFTTNLPQLYKY